MLRRDIHACLCMGGDAGGRVTLIFVRHHFVAHAALPARPPDAHDLPELYVSCTQALQVVDSIASQRALHTNGACEICSKCKCGCGTR